MNAEDTAVAREAIKVQWELFVQQCHPAGLDPVTRDRIERAFHGGVLAGVGLTLRHRHIAMLNALDEWRLTSSAVKDKPSI